MNRPRPASPDVINDLKARMNILIKLGPVTKDFIISSEEASALTGLSVETVRRYGRYSHFSTFRYPGRNFYSLKDICEWVEARYAKATVQNTADMNTGAKMGRPKKKKA